MFVEPVAVSEHGDGSGNQYGRNDQAEEPLVNARMKRDRRRARHTDEGRGR